MQATVPILGTSLIKHGTDRNARAREIEIPMALKCWDCGDTGHISAACPNRADVDGSGWCGRCDQRTRLVDHGDRITRCPACHPLRGQELPQHRICRNCGQRVPRWDQAPCSHHHVIA